MTFEAGVNTIKLLKALNNSLRLNIVEFIINSSSLTRISFTAIKEHLEEQIGREINRGTMSYHLDLLVQGNVLNRELNRTPGEPTYSSYNITDYAMEKLEALGLIERTGE